MIETANRLQTVEEYYFSRKLKEVNALKASGNAIINLAIGSPDLQPPESVVQAIINSFDTEGVHKYQSYQGLPELRKAMASFYKTQFNVRVNYNTEVLPLMGSKEGIMHISMAFLNKGDGVLVPNPGYPTYTSVTNLLEAKPIYYNLDPKNDWLPDLEALSKTDLSRVKIMWINYPHMPTGANVTEAQLKEIVDFARANDILLINDNPYSFILNDNPLSLLSIPNAKDSCLELNSLSKTFNMAGWRVGMVLGDKKYLESIIKVKSNMDSGMFYGIQKGAIEALNCSSLWYGSLNSVYQKRREAVWRLAKKLNCTYNEDATGLFVWAKLPKGIEAEAFIDDLLVNKHVFLTPGTIFGSQGEGYIRFSLCATLEDIEEAIQRIQ